MFVPVSTDAPVKHGPFMTVGLIVINLAVSLGVWLGGFTKQATELMKTYEALEPAQWLLCVVLHPSPWYLAANVAMLWVLGLIVEGKLGPLWFAGFYLLCGMLEAALHQAWRLDFDGPQTGAVGATAAVYGMMALVMVWAPRNNLRCVYWVGALGVTEVQVGAFCVLYLILDITATALGLGTGWMHLVGVAVGLPLGLTLLMTRVVDCHGWDMFSVWKEDPRRGLSKEDRDLRFAERRRELEQTRTFEMIDSAHAQIKHYLKHGNALAAHKLLVKIKESGGQEVPLEEHELVPLIKQLQGEKRWQESAPYLARLIDRVDPKKADQVRLKLAQLCVVELTRPARAVELLKQINLKRLDPSQLKLAKSIAARARELEPQADLELDDDQW